MARFVWAFVVWAILASVYGQDDDSLTDETRPYKFAFNIEGYQHRSEEKDTDGIIMGEFGFVTGDGVYHVTVYATDKDGDFKILSMKSYYVGLPGEPTTIPPPSTQSPPRQTTAKNAIQQHLDGLKGCSGCLIPFKGTGSDAPPKDNQLNVGPGPQSVPKIPTYTTGKKPGTKPAVQGNHQTYPQQPGKPPVSSGVHFTPSAGPIGGNVPSGGTKPSSGQGTGSNTPTSRPTLQGSYPLLPVRPVSADVPIRPVSADAPSHPNPPKYIDGLPPGMTMEDLKALFYKFNYTLRFHGHHESGYRSGDKEGGYFFNGRDGFGRDVKYIANEFGFQPNISLVELGLNSPDTPKEDTEKELNELRGNEFKWFYQR